MSLPMYSFEKITLNSKSLTTTQIGDSEEVKEALSLTMQVDWSGGSATAGNITIDASVNNNIWNTIASKTVSTTSGSFLVNIDRAGFPYIRATWTPTAGTGGTISATVTGKRM